MHNKEPMLKEIVTYEVITTKFDKNGNKEHEEIKRYKQMPQDYMDLKNSQKMLEIIKKDTSVLQRHEG